MVAAIIIASILIRMLCQMQTFSDGMYFTGRDFFDVGMLTALCFYVRSKWLKDFILFILGFAVYNFIEPVFTDPTEFDWSEYWGLILGVLFVIIRYVYRLYKRTNN